MPKTRRIEPPRLAFEPLSVIFRGAGGDELDEAARRAMLREVRQGEPHQLELEVVAFRQSATPRPLPKSRRGEANANFSLFEQDRLEQLARSFRGTPFLRDHTRSQAAVGGYIERAEARTSGDWTEFVMFVRLQAQWAVESALEGTMRTFSIGSDFRARNLREIYASIICTVCDGPYFGAQCGHLRGEEVKHDATGETHIVEVLFRNMRGAELSATPFPAVAGTGIDDMRAALSENHTMDEICKLLGLAEDAPKADVVAAVANLMEAATEPQKPAPAAAEGAAAELSSQLAAEKEAHAETQAALEKARAELAADREEKRQADEDALVARALAEGRMRPANKAIEGEIRRLAATSVAAAGEYVDNLPKLDPIGRELDADPAPAPTAGNKFGLTERQVAYCDQMGVSYETYRQLLDEEREAANA